MVLSFPVMSDVLLRLTTALESRYRVGRQIGVGGMATVYLAHDLRHERDVAIKVLHPDLAAALGAERFLAEIKTTAKLQHPHILPLLDSGEADGLLFYVMPYVAGESLRNRLERETQLAVDDAIRIGREVASALESAHKQGVVHRDIKPENILLHEDQALVADFGIALAVSAAGGARMTQTGLSLGTPQYMAPEQAMGERAIDGRADIYALGAVLYEMLVGEAPFTGPTVQAIVARVMTENPRPVTGQRRSVPPHVNVAILKALEKLPADRFHSAAEFSKALVTPGVHVSDTRADSDAGIGQRRPQFLKNSIVPWAVAASAILAAGAMAIFGEGRSESQAPIHLAIDLPSEMTVDATGGNIVGISPDGSMVAFGVVMGARSHVVLRRLSEDKVTLVPGSTDANGSAEFSADGKWLAFSSGARIYKMPSAGGPPTLIGNSKWAQMAWIGNDAIIYTKNYDSGLHRISAGGTDSVELTRPDRAKGELGHWWPQVLPGGKQILFTAYHAPADKSTIEVIDIDGKGRRVVLQDGYYGRYVDGYLLFAHDNAIRKVAFDPRSLKATGSPVPIQLDVQINQSNGWAGFAVSNTGTLAYIDAALNQVVLKWVDERGEESVAVDSAGRITNAAASPDGKKIALVRDGDVWTLDRQRGLLTRLTNTSQIENDLLWTPDSREVIYVRDAPQFDVFKRTADASKAEELVLTSPHDKSPTSVSPDGKNLLYTEDVTGTNDVYMASPNPAERRAPVRVIDGPRGDQEAVFSPDGQWIAYTSRESGRDEVYVVPFPVSRGPARQQLSLEGGSNPQWGPDGRAVYYNGPGGITRVRINPRTAEIGRPESLSRIGPVLGWEIAPDGRFLVGKSANREASRSVKVVLNWTQTLSAQSER